MMAHKLARRKLARATLVVACALVSQPAFAQRGGGGGGGGGGQCNGGGATTSNVASSIAPYAQNPMANQYALQQMQQRYAQQTMAMRQMYAQLQMENQMLRNQMMRIQNASQLAQAKATVKNENGDSNILLTATKDPTASTKKRASAKGRTAAQRPDQKGARPKAAVDVDADQLALNHVK